MDGYASVGFQFMYSYMKFRSRVWVLKTLRVFSLKIKYIKIRCKIVGTVNPMWQTLKKLTKSQKFGFIVYIWITNRYLSYLCLSIELYLYPLKKIKYEKVMFKYIIEFKIN